MLRVLLLLVVPGCGTLLRAEAGPTWIEGDGLGGTLQGTVGWAPVAGYGLFDFLVIGAYGTATQRGLAGGLLLGCDFGVTPGGLDGPRGEATREGVGGALRFHPRFDKDGVALGGGLGVLVGEGQRIGEGRISLADHEKGGLSFSWDERRWLNALISVDVAHTLVEGQLSGGVWRIDGLVGIERMVLTD